jgi:crotonobetainyl-CoA:carnitine CoA-transferase CaiB-like acyl-CoA transferase
MNEYLDRVRVLDLTQLMAGSLCAMLLGDLGVDVVKVEPSEGEVSRTLGHVSSAGASDFFWSMNRNKRSIVIDLKTADGVAVLNSLVAHADVVIENFLPGVAERLGIGYEALSRANAALVYCVLKGFGSEGPGAKRPASDPIVQAASGSMSLTGTRHSGPLQTGFPVTDHLTPLSAALGVLAALHHARSTGQGQRVDDEDLALDPRFATNALHLMHRDEVDRQMANAFGSASRDEWMRRLEASAC